MDTRELQSNLIIDIENSRQALDVFLSSVQRRAFAMARSAAGNNDDAMDLVQDSMLQLVKSYADREIEEWRKLFFRILNNKINDLFRRRKLLQRFGGILPGSSHPSTQEPNTATDPFDKIPAADGDPSHTLQREETINSLHSAIIKLPRRQREAFMLRCWEGFSTQETAETMGCSQGSVKTHYSRALLALRTQLEEQKYENCL